MIGRHMALTLLSAGTLLACSPDSESTADVESSGDRFGAGEVAYVNGTRIPRSVFELYTLNTLQTDADNLTPEGRADVIERLVRLQVLADEAERIGLPNESEIAAELELQRLQTLARRMTEHYRDQNPPTEAELRDTYEFNLPRLRRTEYKTRHILVDTESEAISILDELRQGASFDELAAEHSIDEANANDGGDLGWEPAENWVGPFAQAVREATPGELPDAPTRTQYGWHIILVDDVSEQAAPGLESVREDLIVATETQKLEEFTLGLIDAANVEIAEN